ncbi:unnamed protein product [Phytomonas sp. Hart1]|nr:unnamed protein product [Phytomonas sp. Hart1]|eukprot:CCW67692.1 unnamed protein product [Phytomonas sp. isolate Hart1]
MQLDLSRHTLDTFDVCKHLTSYAAANHLDDASCTLAAMQITHLDLSFNALHVVSGLKHLPHLRVLNLSHNLLSSLEDELPPRLSNLNISYNKLSTLRSGALQPLQKLQTLDISFNCLKDLHGFPEAPDALRVLNVCGNQLTTLSDIMQCIRLEELYANKNALKEANDLSVLEILTQLRVFTLSENPILLFPKKVQAIHLLLPPDLEQMDVPPMNVLDSVNRSSRSTSTAVASVKCENDEVVIDNEASEIVEVLMSIPSAQQEVQPHTFFNTQPYSLQQPHDIASIEADEVHANGSSRASMGLPSPSRSHECGGNIQPGCQSPHEKETRGPPPDLQGSLPVEEAWQLVHKQVMVEREAYRLQVEAMQKKVHDLTQLLEEQREATFAMLRINEQLGKRLLPTLAKGGRRDVGIQCNAPHKVNVVSITENADSMKRLDGNPPKRYHAASPRLASPRTRPEAPAMPNSPLRIPPLAPRPLTAASTSGGNSPKEDNSNGSMPRRQPRSQSALEAPHNGSLRHPTIPSRRIMSPSPTSPVIHNDAQMVGRDQPPTHGSLNQRAGPNDLKISRKVSTGTHPAEPKRNTREVATALMSLLRHPDAYSDKFR